MAEADEKRAAEWRQAARAGRRAAGAAGRGQHSIEIPLGAGGGAGPDAGQVIDLEVPICSN